jgi:hypothetical protein
MEFFQEEHGEQEYLLVLNDISNNEDVAVPLQRIFIAFANSSALVGAIKYKRAKCYKSRIILSYPHLLEMSLPLSDERQHIDLDFENIGLAELDIWSISKVVNIRNLRLYVPYDPKWSWILYRLDETVAKMSNFKHLTLDVEQPLTQAEIEMVERMEAKGITFEVLESDSGAWGEPHELTNGTEVLTTGIGDPVKAVHARIKEMHPPLQITTDLIEDRIGAHIDMLLSRGLKEPYITKMGIRQISTDIIAARPKDNENVEQLKSQNV